MKDSLWVEILQFAMGEQGSQVSLHPGCQGEGYKLISISTSQEQPSSPFHQNQT